MRLEHSLPTAIRSNQNFNSIKVRLERAHLIIISDQVPNFNSIKVRLEQQHSSNTRTPLYYFNSIKVRLEPFRLLSSEQPISDFNSIKVRLERLQNSTTLSKYLFQFHKGAIRTNTTTQRLKLYPPFQFHKGAIRTI